MYRKFNFPTEIVQRRNELESINDINKIKEKFICPEHKDKVGQFFCEKHRADGSMCEICCEKHIRECSNLGSDEAIKKIDYEKHSIKNVVNYISKKMMKGLKILNDVFSQYSKISKISSLILNYEKLTDYNYYYLDKAIDRKFNDIIKLVDDHRHRLKIAIKKDYEDRVNRVLIKKKIKKFEDWDVFKKEISDDYYSIHNSVEERLLDTDLSIMNLLKIHLKK